MRKLLLSLLIIMLSLSVIGCGSSNSGAGEEVVINIMSCLMLNPFHLSAQDKGFLNKKE